MTTKAQERKALEQIKKILSDLGDGYLATAFEGCLEDAENNIDDDAAYSMKSRWEIAEQKVETLSTELAEIKEAYTTAKEQIEEYNKSSLSPEDRLDCMSIVNHMASEIESQIKQQNEIIIAHAETPEDQEFKSAVSVRKQHTALLNAHRALYERILATL